jgi:hypothetical protein
MGEVSGVTSKGVEDWVLSMKSKFERPDGGLVLGDDEYVPFGNGVCWNGTLMPVFDIVLGCFFTKRPRLSRVCSWFASIAKLRSVCPSCLVLRVRSS